MSNEQKQPQEAECPHENIKMGWHGGNPYRFCLDCQNEVPPERPHDSNLRDEAEDYSSWRNKYRAQEKNNSNEEADTEISLVEKGLTEQPQEGKPLTAKEFFNQYMVARQNYPLEAWASELAERYADYQTAALRDDFRQMMERRDHWKKEAELLREELEVIKARNEGLEQEKQEYIDKYNLAISELEAVKKERDQLIDQNNKEWAATLSCANRKLEAAEKEISEFDSKMMELMIHHEKQISEVTRQRDELYNFCEIAAFRHVPIKDKWQDGYSKCKKRLSSGDTKLVNKCWENDSPKPCTELQIKAGQCGCNPNRPENPDCSKSISEWISVEERLPERGNDKPNRFSKRVWVGNPDHDARLEDSDNYDFELNRWHRYGGRVKYWMPISPLPAPPESLTDKKIIL